MSACEQIRHELGGYVLDGLDPDEVQAVETHLEGCERCRAEHEDLAGVPALLALARRPAVSAPNRLRDRVVAEAARRQGRQRWIAGVAAAVVLSAVLGGVVGWALRTPPLPAVAVPLQGVEPFEAAGVATFALTGTQVVVTMDLEGLQPLEAPGVYEAWLSTTDGRVVSIGQLDAASDGTASVRLVAQGAPEDFRGFWVTAEPDARDPAHDGPTVLRAPVPHIRDGG